MAFSKSGKACLEIAKPSLPPDSRIALVFTPLPQSSSDARVTREACPGNDKTGTDLHRYEIRPTRDNLASSMPAIAVADFSGRFAKAGDLVAADLDGDGQQEYFRSCTSTEGIHFTVWSGKPLEGKLRWHQYYYLGYDVDPNCTAMEARSP